MNRSNLLRIPSPETETPAFQKEGTRLCELYCGHSETANLLYPPMRVKQRRTHVSREWEKNVPALITKLSSLISERKQQGLRALVESFENRIHRLESMQTLVVPINTFAPEPYELLKTFFVSVHSVEGGFEASWYDANIHTSGENEEEAVSNLKSLILDFFDSLSKEPPERLGVEPKRQLSVINSYIKRTP